jgi:hypothetical protein
MKKLIAAALLLPSLAISQELTQFENGQVADADVVNQNFQVLKDAIENVDVSPTVLPRDMACTQNDIVGQWYQTKGVTGGFEISVSNFYSSGRYIYKGLTITPQGQQENTIEGTYSFDSGLCAADIDIINLYSYALAVLNVDKSVMKLTAGDGFGVFGDFTLILISDTPDASLLNKSSSEQKRSPKSLSPKDFATPKALEYFSSSAQ